MTKRASILVTAFITALLVAILYESGLRDSLLSQSTQGSTPASIVYCTKEITAGSQIAIEQLSVKQVPVSQCPANSVYDIWIAVGRIAKQTLEPGDVVYFENVGLAEKINRSTPK